MDDSYTRWLETAGPFAIDEDAVAAGPVVDAITIHDVTPDLEWFSTREEWERNWVWTLLDDS